MSDRDTVVLFARYSNTLNSWIVCERTDRGAIAFTRLPPNAPPAIGPELDKALDAFVADKPKDIMR